MTASHTIEPMPAQDRRRDTARQNARLQAQRTLEWLAQGIATLAKGGKPITAKTIEIETGLSYRTITRNTEAYVLFCKHAAYFQPRPPTRTDKETRKPASAPVQRRLHGIHSSDVRNGNSLIAYGLPSSNS